MKVLDKMLEVLFPPRCPCCGELNDGGEPCEICSVDIVNQVIMGKVCRYCGLEKHNCQCNRYHYLFAGTCSPYYNRDTAKEGVYLLKFRNAPYAADFFGKRMAETLVQRFPKVEFDTVCIVPSTRKSLSERKYDYIELLAKALVKQLKLPLEKGLLKKIRNTERQHTLAHDKRQANVKGAYKATKRLDGKTVLLVDDIKTTGYTLNECAKQLRMAGAEKVYCVTALQTLNNSCKQEQNEI